jgi:hypothetical protein
MRQMMWGDVEADTVHMKPMHAFTSQQVVFSPDRRLLDGMPGPARSGLLSVIAAYLPYYTSEREVRSGSAPRSPDFVRVQWQLVNHSHDPDAHLSR